MSKLETLKFVGGSSVLCGGLFILMGLGMLLNLALKGINFLVEKTRTKMNERLKERVARCCQPE